MATTADKPESKVDPYLVRFIRLAQRGKHRGASSGEKAAYQIAKCLTEHASALDGQATVGMKLFAEFASYRPWACREALES